MRWATGAAVCLVALLTGTCKVGDLTNAPPPLAKLAVSAAAIVDSAAAGSTLRHAWSVTISNAGQGVLAWTAQPADGSSWVSLTPTSGTAPGTVSIMLNPATLGVGVYRDTVLLAAAEAANSPMRLSVEFHVDPCAITPVTLDIQVSDSLRSSDCSAPHRAGRFARLYSFPGALGDSITVTLASSAFGPYVVLDSTTSGPAPSLAETGSCAEQSGACLTYVLLPRAGTYVVEASSAAAGQTGAYSLSVHRPRPPNAPDSLRQVRSDSVSPIPVGGSINQASVVMGGVVSDPDAGDSLRLDVEARPLGAAFTGTATASGTRVANGRHALVAVSGLSNNTAYHWQARTADQTGRMSAWLSFGGNPETAADFSVAIPPSAAQSTVATTPAAIVAGSGSAAITVTARDANGNPVSGATVVLVATGSGNTLTQPSGPTNASGVATGTLSSTVVEGKMISATISGIAITQTAAVTVTAAVPSASQSQVVAAPPSITASTGSNQSTITVTVKDAFGNPVSGATVILAAMGSGNTLTQPSGPTNGGGVATGTLSSTKAEPKTATATANGVALTQTASVAVNAAAPGQIAKNLGDNQSAPAGTSVRISPAVLVSDQFGNPVAGVGVTFAVASGGGTVNPATAVTTSASGIAAVTSWTLGGTAGPNTLTATAAGLTGSSVSFTATGTAGTATQIALNAGNNQAGAAGMAVVTAPSVIVRDVSGNPVAGVAVTFAVPGTSNGSLTGPGQSTNASGIAIVGGWTLSPVAKPDTMTATSTGLVGSPLMFVDTAKVGAAANLAKFSGDNLTGQVGTTLATLHVVLVTDANGNPVPNVTIGWAAATGGGSVNPTSSVTGSDGKASTTRTLGPLTGTQTTTASGLGLTTVTFSVVAQVGGVTQMGFADSSVRHDTVGRTISAPLAVKVMDALNNPVQGVTISWAVLHGGGSVNPASSVTTSSGIATTSWALGTTISPTDSTQFVQASGVASPLTFTAFTVPGPVSASQTGVTASSPVTASSGSSASTITVTARDQYGNVIKGKTVTLTAMGTANTLTNPATPTDVNGVAIGTLSSTASETKTVAATVGGLAIAQQPAVVVNAAAPSSIAVNAGNAQAATVNTAVPTNPSVIVRDQFSNPVPGASVTFAVTSGGGTVNPATAVTTSASGIVGVTSWTLGGTAGPNTLTATAAGLTGSSVSFTATGTAGTAMQIALNAGNNQTDTAGTAVPIAPAVLVTDQFGNGVDDIIVTFAAASGGGSVTGATPGSNMNGVAAVGGWTLGTAAGPNTLTATASGLAGSPLMFSATGVAGSATQLTITTQPAAAAQAGVPLSQQPALQLRDANGNAVSQAGVMVTATASGATLRGATATTNANGVASFTALWIGGPAGPAVSYTLGFASGNLPIVTSSAIALSAGPAAQVAKQAGDNQTAPAGTAVAVPPAVHVVDAFNNPVVGVGVLFTVASGGGTVSPTIPVATSSSGSAAVTSWTLGPTAGPNTLTATATGLAGSPVTFTDSGSVGGPSRVRSMISASPATIVASSGTSQSTITQSTITVTVLDTNSTPVSGASVTLAATGSGNTLTQPVGLTNASGQVTGTLSSTKAGRDTVSATVNGSVTVAATAAVTVTAGAPTQLAFAVQPTTTTAGQPITPAVQVNALDGFSNLATGFAAPVTVAIASGTGTNGAALLGTVTVSAVAGVATFWTLSVDSAGTGYELTASAAGPSAVTSTAFAITAGPAASLNFTVQPTNIAAGALMVPGVQVTARDAVGNKATSFTGTVSVALAINPNAGKLYGATSRAAAGGVAVFSDLTVDSAASGYTLQATPSTLIATSSPFSVAAAPSVLFVGAGDIAGCAAKYGQAQTAPLLANVPVNGSNTVFAVGDIAYDSGTVAQYQNCYDPTWGAQKARTRPVPGNHETQTPGAAGYWQYFTEFSPTVTVGDSGRYWYSYPLGAWHIIALNSETAVTVGSPQEQWLQADLAANSTTQCTLAYWHRPYFTSGTMHLEANQAYLQPLWQDLYNAGAEIVVSGHEHHYERFAPQTAAGVYDPARGIREFVAGTGGAPLYNDPTSPPVANLEMFNGTTWGVLKLTLYTSTYTWEFVPVAGGTFTDQGTGSCH